MVGRFVCVATQLADLLNMAGEATAGTKVCVLGRGGDDGHEWVAKLPTDWLCLQQFAAQYASSVATFESINPVALSRIPDENGAIVQLLNGLNQLLQNTAISSVTGFFEAPMLHDWRDVVPRMVSALSEFNQQAAAPLKHVGFKFRTGGLTPETIPTVEQLAWVIACCRDAGLPWKATAGLHHPFRHENAALGASFHGFLNVLTADILAAVHHLDETRISEILDDTNPSHFTFTDHALQWHDLQATVDQFSQRRLTTIGSCSISEPVEDLHNLKLLPLE